MLMNLRNAMMAGKRLPYDRRVEYLKFTGAQYLNTGINLYGATSFKADISFLQPLPSYDTYQGRLFSSEGGGNNYRDLNISRIYNSCYIRPNGGSFSFTNYYGVKMRYTFDGATHRVYANDVLIHSANNEFVAQASSFAMLFGRRANNATAHFNFDGRVYSASFELNGAPHWNCYPVIDKQGVACFYNEITGGLIYSATSTPLQSSEDDQT